MIVEVKIPLILSDRHVKQILEEEEAGPLVSPDEIDKIVAAYVARNAAAFVPTLSDRKADARATAEVIER